MVRNVTSPAAATRDPSLELTHSQLDNHYSPRERESTRKGSEHSAESQGSRRAQAPARISVATLDLRSPRQKNLQTHIIPFDAENSAFSKMSATSLQTTHGRTHGGSTGKQHDTEPSASAVTHLPNLHTANTQVNCSQSNGKERGAARRCTHCRYKGIFWEVPTHFVSLIHMFAALNLPRGFSPSMATKKTTAFGWVCAPGLGLRYDVQLRLSSHPCDRPRPFGGRTKIKQSWGFAKGHNWSVEALQLCLLEPQ